MSETNAITHIHFCNRYGEVRRFVSVDSKTLDIINAVLDSASPTAREVAGAILKPERFTDYAIAKGLARMIEVQKTETEHERGV